MSKLTYRERVKRDRKKKQRGKKGGNIIEGQSRIRKRNRLATATTVRKTINNINKN